MVAMGTQYEAAEASGCFVADEHIGYDLSGVSPLNWELCFSCLCIQSHSGFSGRS